MLDEMYSVNLSDLIAEFNLTSLYMPEDTVKVESMEVNRPGLCLSGFFDHFDNRRIEIIGNAEYHYLHSLTTDQFQKKVSDFFLHKPVATIITRNLPASEYFIEQARKNQVPLLSTTMQTSQFMAAVIGSLSLSLAPRITRHAVFVEVYGEGVLIMGDSGIGKSETAIELVKRGHRLIADDAVEIKKTSARTLVGSAPEIIRHYIELRGIGIVDVKRLFGMGAVKNAEKIDLVVALEPWDSTKNYDRFGDSTDYEEFMGIKIPKLTIPVKPGRNLAVILEIAAMNNRQKKMGYDTAAELEKKLSETYGG
jgi:HPr kinase/phosphorylase